MVNTRKIFILFLLTYSLASEASGQRNNIYSNMSLDELLNIDVVVTASKQPEDLFETPLSVTIIKKEDILRAGATSIMEALRLSQGLIVREVTPGNYDVQIRGFDDMTKNTYIYLPYNTSTLVMIDNRIVYSYFSGGTFWETLPVDIQDVERIEVVRGPASALYGPNAATGVINIITSHAEKQGLNVNASGTIGNANAKIVSADIGYNWSDKTSLTFTGNFTERSRIDNMYYDCYNQEYTTLDNMLMMMDFEKNNETHERWTYQEFSDSLHSHYDVNRSLQKMGANIFFDHKFDEKSNFNLAIGTQKSQCQKPGFLNFATPLSQNNSTSFYIDSKFKIRNFFGQFNLSSGEDLSSSANSFKYRNSDVNLEYLFQYKNLSLRPGLSFKNCSYNSPVTYDEPFDLAKLNYQFKDQPRILNTVATSLLADWNPLPKLRVIGGLRIDKFNINKNYFTNYELGITYRIGKNNLIRAVYSHANRSPSIFDTYVNITMDFYYPYQAETNTNLVYIPVEQNILAKKDQKYPTNSDLEFGWRSKISPKVDIDTEFFYHKLTNLLVSTENREIHSKVQLTPENEIDSIISGFGLMNMYFENYDVGARQFGVSFMLHVTPNPRLDMKLYGTAQKTILNGITDFQYTTTDTKINIDQENNILSTIAFTNANMTLWSEKLTPTLYGGFMLNYMPAERLNLNLNSYMYTKQVFAGTPFYNIISDYTGIYWDNYMTIEPYAVVNAKVIYQLMEKTKVYFSVKNMFGKHREFGFTDNIGTTILIGFQWNY